MKIVLFLATALSVVMSLAMAVPLAPRETGGVRPPAPAPLQAGRKIVRLTSWKVLICTGANATGACDYGVYELDRCYDLAPPLLRNTSTFAPDDEAFYCYPYA